MIASTIQGEGRPEQQHAPERSNHSPTRWNVTLLTTAGLQLAGRESQARTGCRRGERIRERETQSKSDQAVLAPILANREMLGGWRDDSSRQVPKTPFDHLPPEIGCHHGHRRPLHELLKRVEPRPVYPQWLFRSNAMLLGLLRRGAWTQLLCRSIHRTRLLRDP
jgi:hypothetical protein